MEKLRFELKEGYLKLEWDKFMEFLKQVALLGLSVVEKEKLRITMVEGAKEEEVIRLRLESATERQKLMAVYKLLFKLYGNYRDHNPERHWVLDEEAIQGIFMSMLIEKGFVNIKLEWFGVWTKPPK